jgi:hypothetical protein
MIPIYKFEQEFSIDMFYGVEAETYGTCSLMRYEWGTPPNRSDYCLPEEPKNPIEKGHSEQLDDDNLSESCHRIRYILGKKRYLYANIKSK